MLNAKYLFLTLSFALCFLTINAEAGCNGSCSVSNGDDWTITEDTHMWDEEINFKDLTVDIGATLKLENVQTNITGHVDISGNTEWIDSEIIFLGETTGSNITVNKKLEIISSNVSFNYTNYAAGNVRGFYLAENSKLIIKDSDNNPSTPGDRSIIKTLNNTWISWYINNNRDFENTINIER